MGKSKGKERSKQEARTDADYAFRAAEMDDEDPVLVRGKYHRSYTGKRPFQSISQQELDPD